MGAITYALGNDLRWAREGRRQRRARLKENDRILGRWAAGRSVLYRLSDEVVALDIGATGAEFAQCVVEEIQAAIQGAQLNEVIANALERHVVGFAMERLGDGRTGAVRVQRRCVERVEAEEARACAKLATYITVRTMIGSHIMISVLLLPGLVFRMLF